MSMKWGLLWYDAEGTLAERVGRAKERYVEKHGTEPNICFVHMEFYTGDVITIDGCVVVANKTILKDNFWIGEASELSQV